MEKIKISRYEDFKIGVNGLSNKRGFKLYFNQFSEITIKLFITLDSCNIITFEINENKNLKEIINILNKLGFNFEIVRRQSNENI